MNNKIFLLAIFSILLFAACGRKNIPAKTTTTVKTERPPVAPDRIADDKKYMVKATVPVNKVEGNENVEANIKANAAKAPTAAEKAVAVIDSKGNVVIDRNTLPAHVNHNLDSISMVVRAYTPNQAKNLSSRYNFIPPRVIYVPASMQKQGTKGVYFLYKIPNNALWYWKRSDGYFYIDENHYQ